MVVKRDERWGDAVLLNGHMRVLEGLGETSETV